MVMLGFCPACALERTQRYQSETVMVMLFSHHFVSLFLCAALLEIVWSLRRLHPGGQGA